MIRASDGKLAKDIVEYLGFWFNESVAFSHPGWELSVRSCSVNNGEISISVSLLYHKSEQSACLLTEKINKTFDIDDAAKEIIEWAISHIREIYASIGLTENDRVIAKGGREDEDIAPEVRSAVEAWQKKVKGVVESFKINTEYEDDYISVSTVSNVDFDNTVSSEITITVMARYDMNGKWNTTELDTFSFECEGCIGMDKVTAFLEDNRGFINDTLTKFYKNNRFDPHTKMRGYDSDKRAGTKKSIEKLKTKQEQQQYEEQQRAAVRKAIKKIMSR